ncbi:PKD domain-containing protein [Pararhodonellum marinum]|uniref:PKD domain-containing protein n=1 Tax=Pararhodonellum marinum TaxID=2755358 RepID=UPI00188EDDD5|nr:PKD domain-containing protein [Pararhodonellum marinum]
MSVSQAQVGFPYCENFTGTTTGSATVLGGDARLTDGVLRLTDNQQEQNGYVYIDIPFSSAFGIKTSFEYFSYGGSGADGLTVFLFDAAVNNFRPGGFGGSLGYAQRTQTAGLTGAYIGIGFDEFGNFGNALEGKSGSFQGGANERHPNSVVVRGPGNGLDGYPFISGVKTTEAGPVGLPPAQQFPISSGGVGTNRVTDPNVPGYRQVFINLEPNPNGLGYLLTVEMLVTTAPGDPRMVTIFDNEPYPFEAPADLKIGFAASTGGETNFHEIRNMVVQVSNEDDLEEPEGVDIDDVASCEGQENTYEILPEDIFLPNENSNIRCIQFYASEEDIEAESDDICSQGQCREENRQLEIPEGIFRAAAEGGSYTFFPNFGFTDETVRVYYTITDNYGKTSPGNYITLLIQESPEPVQIFSSDSESFDEEHYQSAFRLCEGELLPLQAVGNEDYFRFEWFLDNSLIEGEAGAVLLASEEGWYKVLAYNDKGCPAESGEVELIYPSFPDLRVEERIVSCEIGGIVDIREYIQGYDENLFDYRLTSLTGTNYVNDEMGTIDESGLYTLSIKHKDLECWSAETMIEVLILEEGMEPFFDFLVPETGITNPSEGGIFVQELIQFTDYTPGTPLAWQWDFGDGSRSEEQNPQHAFQNVGTYQVQLTVLDDLGCTFSFESRVEVSHAYRIMFPDAFTPSGNENRTFRPETKGLVKAELRIFSQWGEMVYLDEVTQDDGWDGNINGLPAPPGNYVYRLDFVAVDGESGSKTGKFLLLR